MVLTSAVGLASLAPGITDARAAGTCVSNGHCPASSPCAWSEPGTWVSCGGGIPGAGDRWRVSPADTVVYDLDGARTGGFTVEGTLRFSDLSAPRDQDGFRNLIVVADGSTSSGDVVCMPGGAIVLRRGDRLRFDTTAGKPADIFLLNRCLWDSRGSVTETTIAAVIASAPSGSLCGSTTSGRMYVINPTEGGPFADARHRHRRIVFQSGRLKDRQYEIVRATRLELTVCTDLPDAWSGGQRLTPHALVGSFSGTPAHSTPVTAAGDPRMDPSEGDRIAIVEDVWIDQSAGTAGYRFADSNSPTGTDPFPIFKAVNFAGLGPAGFDAASLAVASPDQFVPDFEYNNWHDWKSNFGFVFRGAKNFTIRWNAVHDAAPGAGDNYCAICVHQEKTAEGSGYDTPVANVDISNNVAHGFRHSAFNINDADSWSSGGDGTGVSYAATGITIRENLIFGGCSIENGFTTCSGLEVDACRGCDVARNVLFGLCTPNRGSGNGVLLAGDTGNEGTAIHDNWMVNLCGAGIVTLDGSYGRHPDANQRVGITHNYLSHFRRTAAIGGRYFSNVVKNFGLDGSGLGSGLQNPVVAEGNFIMGVDDPVASSAPCSGASGCARTGIDLLKDAGNANARHVRLRDNLIVQLRSGVQRHAVRLRGGGAGFSADFDATIEHLTIDNRGGALRGVSLEQDTTPPGPVTITMNDLVTTHDAEVDAVLCPATPGITGLVGQVQSTQTSNRIEGGGIVGSSCVATGTLTRVSSTGYADRVSLDYNFTPGAAGLTGGGSPPGSPMGVRAFRFDRARLNAAWGGALTFDGAFPADIANLPNTDTDGDGVLDLHDNCPDVFNPAQLDLDDDGYAACGGDCDDLDPLVNPDRTETCDGLDDNCNGLVDEAMGTTTCGLGECSRAVPACVGGVPPVCVPGTPAPETCDGLDNDCNGQVDDGLGTMTCGVGACARTVPACVAGVLQTCVEGSPGAESPATLDSCFDGVDNDCDRIVDLDCAGELAEGGLSVVTGNLTCGSAADLASLSPNNTYACFKEAAASSVQQLTVLFTYSTAGQPAGTNYDLRLEGFRSAGANDAFNFSASTRATPGTCTSGDGGGAVVLSVTKTADDDALQSADLGIGLGTLCITAVGNRDRSGDSSQDTLTLDRLFVFPTPVALQDVVAPGDVGSLLAGSYVSTQRSDDTREILREESSAGGNRLWHTWQFQSVPAGKGHRLHLEGSTAGAKPETFNFYYSTSPAAWSPSNPLTGFTQIGNATISASGEISGDSAEFGGASLAGTVYIRVIDARKTSDQNTLSIDQITIKTVP